MKKLTNQEWYSKFNRVKEMVDEPHEDFNVQLILADLYYTLSEGFIWEFPKMLWRGWKLKRVTALHKKCCDLD